MNTSISTQKVIDPNLSCFISYPNPTDKSGDWVYFTQEELDTIHTKTQKRTYTDDHSSRFNEYIAYYHLSDGKVLQYIAYQRSINLLENGQYRRALNKDEVMQYVQN